MAETSAGFIASDKCSQGRGTSKTPYGDAVLREDQE